jgi:hypothetical protein
LETANDLYGMVLSNSGAALDTWQAGLHCADTFDASGIAELSQAVKLEPNFALAHAALAKQQMFHGFVDDSRNSLAAAQALISKVTERESSLINVLTASMNFQVNALQMALAHIDRWPLDRFVFSLTVGPFGLLAFSQQADWRERCLALLLHYQKHWPENDWWYLSALAFSKAECGATADGENLAQRAWAQSANGNCAHSLSHAYKEQNDTPKGVEFLTTWLLDHQTGSDMRHHLGWHLALLNLESGSADQAAMQRLYRDEFDPNISDPMPLTTYSDNASILWRCALHNMSLDLSFVEQTLDYGKRHYPELGFGFVDMHRVLLTALSGREQEVASLRTELLRQDHPHYLQNLLNGALAFADGDFAKVKLYLEPVLNDTVLLGGSNPQRGVVLETFIAAQKYA